MTPHKAQRTWHSLSSKWINAAPWGSPFGTGGGVPRRLKNTRRKIKKGILSNFIPVEVVNAITGEIAKGYMRDLSIKKLRKWLSYHNHRAHVEQVYLSPYTTLFNLKEADIKDFPILIKLGKYQMPYLIENVRPSIPVRNRNTVAFELKISDNLKYLEIVARKKRKVMALFNKLKLAKKLQVKRRKK
jgi:hypothetical protein